MIGLAIGMIATATAGVALGVTLTLVLGARRQAQAGQLIQQIRTIRLDVQELATLYSRPSGMREDQPRAVVTQLVS
ncbi:MAG: hypothetical protein M3Y42_10270 [Actinomycetota bacterium]|nr:hypothetical protein [Actinomycetota bacterium]MDQ2957338.1 hypothetical protein [Actinomycetota bacterium]